MKNKRLILIILSSALLLFIILIAMQFTDEINWTAVDFVVAGVLLLGTGILCELGLRVVKKTGYRIVLLVIILTAMLLIWAELGVGIFGSPFSGH